MNEAGIQTQKDLIKEDLTLLDSKHLVQQIESVVSDSSYNFDCRYDADRTIRLAALLTFPQAVQSLRLDPDCAQRLIDGLNHRAEYTASYSVRPARASFYREMAELLAGALRPPQPVPAVETATASL